MQICHRHPLRSLLLIAAVLSALALAACGDDSSSGGTGPDPATVTPADSVVYVEATVKPEGEQKDDLLDALSKLTGDDDPGAAIRGQIEEAVGEDDSGLSYQEDVEPWLGQRAGVFVLEVGKKDAEAAVAAGTTDPDATQATIDKAAEGEDSEERTYEDVTYRIDENGDAIGVVGDFLVGGTKTAFEAAVDALAGDSLADDSEATDALDSAPDGSIFRAYVDATSLIDQLVESGQASEEQLAPVQDQLDALAEGPVVVSGSATADSITVEASGPEGAAGDGSAVTIADLPSESWLAVAVPMLGQAVGQGYENFITGFQSGFESGFDRLPDAKVPDVGGEVEAATGLDLSKDLSWAGDASLSVEGTSLFGLGAGMAIETDDEDAAAAAIEKLRVALNREESILVRPTPSGFKLQTTGTPIGAEVAIEDGKVIVAIAGTTVEDVLNPPEALSDAEPFGEATGALGEGLDPSAYIDFEAILALVESTGQVQPDLEAARPTLEALDFLIAGSSGDDDGRSVARAVLGLKDPPPDSGSAAAIAP
jgi:hypothetical protein